MTLAAIKAELRRSAVEDTAPYWECALDAWNLAESELPSGALWADFGPHGSERQADAVRNYYLLLSEDL